MIKRIFKKILCRNKTVPQNDIDFLEKKGLVIGNTSKITMYSPQGIDGLYPWLIEIGEHVIVSTDVSILAHDASTANFLGYSRIGRVIIGNNVYIGHNSSVLCNVKIGDNVVVGAHSLVNKDLESGGVYAGVPAKYICSIDDFINKHTVHQKETPFFDKNFEYWTKLATNEERQNMKEALDGTDGYIKSRKIE